MKKFLGSTGVASLFVKEGGELRFLARVNTLTRSALTFTSETEEVRAGQGAKLLGRYNHDNSVNITLTDAMFDVNYLALQVGSTLQRGGFTMFSEMVESDENGDVVLSKQPQLMGEACGLDSYFVWYREAGCDADEEYSSVVLEDYEAILQVARLDKPNTTYCVSYFTQEMAATTVLVGANFVPAELVLVMTAKLYAGDANAPEAGKPVGEITIKIPRFQLDGTLDLSMAMSSAASLTLSGVALAASDGLCDDEGVYAEVVELIEGAKWYDGLISLYTEYEEGVTVGELEDGDVIDVYGIYRNMSPSYISPTNLIYDVGTTGAVFDDATGELITAPIADGTITIYIKDDDGNPGSIYCTIEVIAVGDYPIYVSTSAGTLVALDLSEGFDEDGVFEYSFEAEIDPTAKQTVAFPPGTPAIVGIQQYDNVREVWDWIYGSATESLNSFDTYQTQISTEWGRVTYTFYENALALIGPRDLRFFIKLPEGD